jgi:hypothetical protein
LPEPIAMEQSTASAFRAVVFMSVDVEVMGGYRWLSLQSQFLPGLVFRQA